MKHSYEVAKTTFISELILELTRLSEDEFYSLYGNFNSVIRSIHTLEKKIEKGDKIVKS